MNDSSDKHRMHSISQIRIHLQRDKYHEINEKENRKKHAANDSFVLTHTFATIFYHSLCLSHSFVHSHSVLLTQSLIRIHFHLPFQSFEIISFSLPLKSELGLCQENHKNHKK